jgi:hypothetical protein
MGMSTFRSILSLETLDDRFLPDATNPAPPSVATPPASVGSVTPSNPQDLSSLIGSSATPDVVTPPEAPWTAGEISLLRAAVSQLQQWEIEDASAHALLLNSVNATSQALATYKAYSEQFALALQNNQAPPAPPVIPPLPPAPNMIQRTIQVAQGLRDLPGSPVQNGFRLTREGIDLYNQGVALNKQAEQLYEQARTLGDLARAEPNFNIRQQLLAGGQAANLAGSIATTDAAAKHTAWAEKLAARSKCVEQIKDFLKDK